MNTKAEKALIDFLEDREKLDVHGNALLVFKDDKEIFRHYTGDSNKDTLYRIFSMTKVVTVTAAMQLYELGKFYMDDPLYQYIPEFEHMTVWDKNEGKAVPAKNPIRIRDVFCMSTGFSYGGSETETERRLAALAGESMKKAADTDISKGSATLQFVKLLAGVPLLFEPGTHWRYGYSHDILAALVEVWSGKRFSDYLEENIFAPLGMKHTFFRVPAELKANMATFDGPAEMDHMYDEDSMYESGGGGLLSTLDDYMKLTRTLARGGTSEEGVHILGRKTIELMAMDQLNADQKKDFNWDYLQGYSYGLGVRTNIDVAKSGIAGNVGEFGWCGMLGTWMLVDPKENLAAVYMHQRMPNLEKYVQTHLRPMIYGLI